MKDARSGKMKKGCSISGALISPPRIDPDESNKLNRNIWRNVMFELSIWTLEYWLVALILILIYEDQNEIKACEVLVSLKNERRGKRLSIGDPVLYKLIMHNGTINISD
jgi:hypothetical protein